ncbi:MAG: hypothetical protein EOO14_20890 [Chitinophagaceae bacterium]|nr:MAG: hypothetical protein EOO14_20890 [Chitinophagaceae bacterium]
MEQLPGAAGSRLAAGTLTAPVINSADQSVTFAYIRKLYPAGEPRSFSQAKGLLINDYQTQLEKEWVEKLKTKYPVSVDEKVWREVVQQLNR